MVRQTGFSLIEVLVALVIVALTIPAFIQLTMTQADGVFYAKRTMQAQWGADYVIGHRALYKRESSAWSRSSGEVEM